jgi:serpin B
MVAVVILAALGVAGYFATRERTGAAGLPMTPETAEESAVSASINAFGIDLYRELAHGDENLVVSPFSASTALSMAYVGAREDTEAQMRAALRYTVGQDQVPAAYEGMLRELGVAGGRKNPALIMANSLWVQRRYRLLDPFVSTLKINYGAAPQPVDFRSGDKARRTINGWIDKRTRGQIRELIGDNGLPRKTRLTVVNALYFNGAWLEPFERADTDDAPFTLLNGNKVQVPTMRQTGAFDYMETKDLQVLRLWYKGRTLTMTILLPRKLDGLSALEKSLTAEALDEWWTGPVLVDMAEVALPRYRASSRFNLKEAMESLGMKDAFVWGTADFSGMTLEEPLFLYAVWHQAVIEVNEEGTRAAAATAVPAPASAPMPEPSPPRLVADHPFMYLIRDMRTGAILFMGRVTNPRG